MVKRLGAWLGRQTPAGNTEAKRNANGRWPGLEPLEPRVLLSGTSVSVGENLPQVSVLAWDCAAAETVAGGAANAGVFRISRGEAASGDLTVYFSVAGTAGLGATRDYTLAGNGLSARCNSVVIPDGQSFVDVTVSPVDDPLWEPAETVLLNLSANRNYRVVSDYRAAKVWVNDNEPMVGVVRVGDAEEGESEGGVFRIFRQGSSSGDLTVGFSLSGTAGLGATRDYTLSGGGLVAGARQVVIPDGQSFVDVTVTPVDDAAVEPAETAVMTLATSRSYSLNPEAKRATVTVLDNEPAVTIEAVDPTARETLPGDEANTAVFRISRSGLTASALAVNLTVRGSATRGVTAGRPNDYLLKVGGTIVTGTVVSIGAGEEYVDVTLVPTNDGVVEAGETVVVGLETSRAYSLPVDAAQRQASATIGDLAVPIVGVTATRATAGERSAGSTGTPGVYTFTRRGGDVDQAVTIDYVMSGSATAGADYETLSGQVTIAAGQTSATVSLVVMDDAVTEGQEAAVLSLSASGAYLYKVDASKGAATVTISDWEVAPDSLGDTTGLYMNVVITEDTDTDEPLPKRIQLYLGADGGPYFTIEDDCVWGGTAYEYQKTSSTQGILQFHDVDELIVCTMTFTSATSGTMTVLHEDGDTEYGTFRTTVPAGSYAPDSLDGRTIVGRSTADWDPEYAGEAFRTEWGSTDMTNYDEGEPEYSTYTYQRIAPNYGMVIENDGEEESWVLLVFKPSNKLDWASFDPFTEDEGWSRGYGVLSWTSHT